MSKKLERLIENYRSSYKHWKELVVEEQEIRQKMIDDNGGEEPEDLRKKLYEIVEDIGLRDKQREALQVLKKSEQELFAFNFDHCSDPELKRELEHLAHDYAARITWLKQFLEPLDVLKEKNTKK